jgi:ribA/ribD-fused uncharacterized protein
MTIYFSNPKDKPYGCFSNASIGYFEVDGQIWRSAEQCFQVQKFLDGTIREEVQRAATPEEAVRLADFHQSACRPDWSEVRDEIMRYILLSKFRRLDFRSVLLQTNGDDIIANLEDPYWGAGVDGTGKNRLGQLLMEVRTVLQNKARKTEECQCPHETEEDKGRVCIHLLDAYTDSSIPPHHYRVYTGNGIEFLFVCAACAYASPDERLANLRIICRDCFEEFAFSCCDGTIGWPGFPQRDAGLGIFHEEIRISSLETETLLDVKPVEAGTENVWVGVTDRRGIWRIDLHRREGIKLFELPTEPVNFAEKVSLEISRDGKLAAVANTHGQYGLVVDTESRKITMQLDREDYHVDVSNFSMAFFDADGQTWLVHATKWNRLDISAPQTGTIVTVRESPVYNKEQRSPHHLDYFHCGLRISPDSRWIADNGWVWMPFGVITTWSLQRWFKENVWESEDGPSNKNLCSRGYYWGGPICWIDSHTLAVWGHGNDDNVLAPAVLIFDAATGEKVHWFAGPVGELFFDKFLFSCDPEHGTAVWDILTGERVYHAPGFCPVAYHRGAKSFLSIPSNGVFRASQIK